MFGRGRQEALTWEDVNAIFRSLMRIEREVHTIYLTLGGDDGEEEAEEGS